jgi:hypothetical protein
MCVSNHPAIISKDVFEEVKNEKTRRSNMKSPTAEQHARQLATVKKRRCPVEIIKS